jgi:hypothetical protein
MPNRFIQKIEKPGPLPCSFNSSVGYEVEAVFLKIICHFQDWMSYFKSHGIHEDDIEKVVIGKRRVIKPRRRLRNQLLLTGTL